MSPKWNDPLQVQLSSSSNETVLHSLVLKKCNVQDSEMEVYKMTVYKRLWYNLQDDSLQGSDMVQFARDRLAVYRIMVCKIWVLIQLART